MQAITKENQYFSWRLRNLPERIVEIAKAAPSSVIVKPFRKSNRTRMGNSSDGIGYG
ncbi:MAG: hypothetical protein IM477_09215 [Microcystis sp. M090S1]|uniref:hypothetical protein n=1 Tax=Microcystis TaxID=1125 RepID=UPI00168182E6|nr:MULTISPECIES: hypothetical protein [Microcystis]MBD2289285.1 hypothetical protein [Microcystis wesenbergii FACHB-1317]MCA2812707.1 hypothetical protein [Microcystis sp. M090S1]UZO77705.1 hypothetical protein M8120_07185 [Microcystis aeruginosa str. Chao 1910]